MDRAKTSVVMVHGIRGSALQFRDIDKTLSKNRKTFIVELEGHGKCHKNSTTGSDLRKFSEFLMKTIKEKGLSKPFLIGFSLGGIAVIKTAIRYSHEISGIALISTPCEISGIGVSSIADAVPVVRRIKSAMMYNRLSVGTWSEEYPGSYSARTRAFECMSASTKHVNSYMLSASKELLKLKISLSQVNCPTLIFHGSMDRVIPCKHASSLNRKISDSELVIVEKGGHMLVCEHPNTIASEIDSFLSNRIDPALTE